MELRRGYNLPTLPIRLPIPVRRQPGQFPLPNVGDWRARWRIERERTRLVPDEATSWFGITQDGAAATTINSTAGTTNTVTVPASMTTGHYLVYSVMVNGNKSASLSATISGWTTLLSPTLTSGSTGTMAVYGRFWASGMANPSVTWTTTAKNVGCIVPFLGVSATTQLDVAVSSTSAAASTSAASPSATAVTMGACRLHIAGRVGTGTSTPDFRLREMVDITTSATNPAALAFDYETDMASDASGTRTSTITSAAAVAATIWLRPATPTTFGLLRSAKANINANTTGTVTLAAGDVANSPTGTLLTMSNQYSAPTTSPFLGAVPTFSGGSFVQAGGFGQSGTGASTYATGIFYFENNTTTGAITFTVTRPTSQDYAVLVQEWKGAALSGALDVAAANNGAAATSSSVTTGTTSAGTKLAIANVAADGTAFQPKSGYEMRWPINVATNSDGATESREFTGGGTENATFSWTTSFAWASNIAVFKAPSSGTTIQGVVVISAAASLGATAQKTARGTPTTAGAATLGLIARRTASGAPSSAGRGQALPAARRTAQAVTSSQGNGSASPVGRRSARSGATTQGQAATIEAGRTLGRGTSTSQGAGSLGATARQTARGAPTSAGRGELVPAGRDTSRGSATGAGRAYVLPGGRTTVEGSATSGGRAYVVPVARNQARGLSASLGSGGLTSTGRAVSRGATSSEGRGHLDVIGSLVAAGAVVQGIAEVVGRGILLVAGKVRLLASGTAAGRGAMSAAGEVIGPAEWGADSPLFFRPPAKDRTFTPVTMVRVYTPAAKDHTFTPDAKRRTYRPAAKERVLVVDDPR